MRPTDDRPARVMQPSDDPDPPRTPEQPGYVFRPAVPKTRREFEGLPAAERPSAPASGASRDVDAEYAEHMRQLMDPDPRKATDPNAGVVALTRLINLLVDCLRESSQTPPDAELIAKIGGARSFIGLNLEADLAAVRERVPAQLDRVCRLPDRHDLLFFVARAEGAAGFFRTLANRYELLGAIGTLEHELRRHGLPSLYEQPAAAEAWPR